jgi:1-acyl-sn-glycerol-3-phosphate acyltransferase
MVLLCAAPLALLAAYFLRRCETLAQWPLLAAQLFYARIVWRATINGPLPVADGQGAVIVCNHINAYDPVLLHLAVRRSGPMRWMVAREYIQGPLLSRVAKALHIISVGRGGIDTKATRMAIRHASEGQLVGIFPEGRINLTDELMLPARPGAAMVALRAKVPVIPCYIEGSPKAGSLIGPLFSLAKIRVVVGSPIDVGEYVNGENGRQAQLDLTLRMLREIALLAGRDDFEPRLAGRRWKPADVDG